MNRKGGGSMARKESVTKNDILEAAFSILQEEGNGAEAGSESQLFHAADFPYLQKY